MKSIHFLMNEQAVEKLDDLMQRTNSRTRTELFSSAVAFLEWAVEEKEAGRSIHSVDPVSEASTEFDMPALNYAGRLRDIALELETILKALDVANRTRLAQIWEMLQELPEIDDDERLRAGLVSIEVDDPSLAAQIQSVVRTSNEATRDERNARHIAEVMSAVQAG